jgi:hypothetical protein
VSTMRMQIDNVKEKKSCRRTNIEKIDLLEQLLLVVFKLANHGEAK